MVDPQQSDAKQKNRAFGQRRIMPVPQSQKIELTASDGLMK